MNKSESTSFFQSFSKYLSGSILTSVALACVAWPVHAQDWADVSSSGTVTSTTATSPACAVGYVRRLEIKRQGSNTIGSIRLILDNLNMGTTGTDTIETIEISATKEYDRDFGIVTAMLNGAMLSGAPVAIRKFATREDRANGVNPSFCGAVESIDDVEITVCREYAQWSGCY